MADEPTGDAWRNLRRLTPARIALGRAGGSLPTAQWLAFSADHAAARDAVHRPLDRVGLENSLRELGVPMVWVRTAAGDREVYLQRPDLGRALDDRSRQELAGMAGEFDLAVVVADGLSSLAAENYAAPVLKALLPPLARQGWAVAPLVLATQARVALQDQVGQVLRARIALTLLGERPGLSAADSLSAYFVFDPRPGKTDADRNCVSNIHRAGLTPELAAETLCYLLIAARNLRISGIALKDERLLDAGVQAKPKVLD